MRNNGDKGKLSHGQAAAAPDSDGQPRRAGEAVGWFARLRGRLGQGRQEAMLDELGDFTTGPRTILIALIAVAIGAFSAFVALALLRLIGLFTNLFFYGRWNTDLVSPAGNHLGAFEVLVPIGGALLIGLMARYGSERIRGHGIPEAIEAILINGSRVQPRVAFLKPLSSAISVGSGGPFGGEGPIIMTGGAFGSLIAQFLHLRSAERKTFSSPAPRAGCRRRSPRRSRRCSWRSSCSYSNGRHAA